MNTNDIIIINTSDGLFEVWDYSTFAGKWVSTWDSLQKAEADRIKYINEGME